MTHSVQATQLYYDPEGGTYYEYDTETCQYQVHSRVKLPKKTARPEEGLEKVVDLCSSSDSETESELTYPRDLLVLLAPPSVLGGGSMALVLWLPF